MIPLLLCVAATLSTIPEALCVKKFPTATRPPPPPPAPPLVVFDQPQPPTGQSEPPPRARFEYFELIAPSQNGQNYNPTLSIQNPDFNVVYRPRPQPQTQRPPVQPQRPPARPQRPPAQPQRPQRPTPPLYQFPQQLQQFQQRPQRPNSQVLTRPRTDSFPAPVHRFAPEAFNQLQQSA